MDSVSFVNFVSLPLLENKNKKTDNLTDPVQNTWSDAFVSYYVHWVVEIHWRLTLNITIINECLGWPLSKNSSMSATLHQ